MPERGFNADLTVWTRQQADALNREFTRPHPSYWTDQLSITAAITTATLRMDNLPPPGKEAILIGTVYGTGVYDTGGAATDVIIIPQVTGYIITRPPTASPPTIQFITLLTAVSTTAAAPVPAGTITWFTYNDFVNAAVGDYTITTAPKIQFRVEMQP